jgi:radical SAM-linked protein
LTDSIRQRVRIRFRKDGDLRWISHRDLVRAFERLLRRAELRLGMSEGFHPKPRMNFPSALSVGIRGEDEIAEIELAEAIEGPRLQQRLCDQAPPGLVIVQVDLLDEGQKKAHAVCQTFEISVPRHRRVETQAAIEELLARTTCPLSRNGQASPIDIRPGLEQLHLDADRLRMRLTIGRQANVHPREILRILGLDDFEHEGCVLTRTAVELLQ